MNNTRLVLLTFGALATFFVTFTYFYAKSTYPSGECRNTEVSRLVAPGRGYEAGVFERSCGNAARSSAHISVLEAGGTLANEFGNAVIVKGSPGDVFGPLVWSGDVLAVKLNSSDVLSLTTNPVPEIEVRLSKD